MKIKLLVCASLSAFTVSLKAQVSDVSVTVAPTVGYNWFDSKSTVENGAMYGFQFGFGFGKVIELRGTYEKSLNLKQNFGRYEGDIQNHFPDFNFADRSIDVSRIGGEFKANIPARGFAPYFLLGTGVQTFETNAQSGNSYKNENLFGTGGLGFKINMGNRTTFNIEGRGIVYNMNPGSLLYNPGGTTDFDNWIDNQNRNRMYNWSLMAGLQFYFGGRNEGDLSAMDKAYLRRFSSGMSGTKLTLSPAAAYVQFNNNSAFRDTYLLGGVLGLDLTDFVGLQGYYYHATENEDLSPNFDKLAMYGADFVGKLNVPRGIVPFVSIGGGYINVRDNYAGRIDPVIPSLGSLSASSSYYAKGGVGVDVPLSQYVQVFGAANLLYTVDKNASDDLTQLRSTDDLTQHTMYNVGLRLNFGKRANTEKQATREFDRRFEDERNAYDSQVKSLEEDLMKAYQENDSRKAAEIMAQKRSIDSIKNTPQNNNGLIRLTPAELESLIDKVLKGVDGDPKKDSVTLENRLNRLEKLLDERNRQSLVPVRANDSAYEQSRQLDASNQSAWDSESANDYLIKEIQRLREELSQERKSSALRDVRAGSTSAPIVPAPITSISVEPAESTVIEVPTSVPVANNASTFWATRRSFGAYIGANFGQTTATNVGIRGYLGLHNSSIYIMPEAYVALGSDTGFGISANGLVPVNVARNVNFNPYAGVGVGLHNLNSETTFTTNIIVGTTYDMGIGSLFADYTVRGLFKNNQVGLGYRFRF